MSTDPVDKYGLSCPEGGKFYICQDSDIQFLGCCTTDPCSGSLNGCPQSDLRYSSFDEDRYTHFVGQQCSGQGLFYNCVNTELPFIGCCSADACGSAEGCPTKDLIAAQLSSNSKSAAIFETTSSSPSITSLTSTSTSTSTASNSGSSGSSDSSSSSSSSSSSPSVSLEATSPTTTLSALLTPSNTAAPASGSSSPGLSKGAIAGISVGGTLFLIGLLAALLFFGRRWKKNRGVVVKGSAPPTPSGIMSNPTNSFLFQDPNRNMHTPPPLQSPTESDLGVLAVVNKSPTHSSSRASSVKSWLSNASRQATVSSGHSSNQNRSSRTLAPNGWQGLPVSPTSPHDDIEQQQQQPFILHSQPLETVAELDSTDISRPISELPGDSLPHSPSMYVPYRPSVGSPRASDFEDTSSELYP